VRSGMRPGEVLARVNRHLCDRGVGGRFVTMAMTEIDPRSHQMEVVNAGHMDPLVRRASGAIESVGRSGAGLPLGVVGTTVYLPVTVALQPGDLIVLQAAWVRRLCSTPACPLPLMPFHRRRTRRSAKLTAGWLRHKHGSCYQR